VVGVLPGIIGCIQACETVKLIVGGGQTLAGRLLLFDAWYMQFSEMKFERDPACPICGNNPTIHELIDYEQFCGLKKPEEDSIESLSALELKERLERGDALQIIDIREPHEKVLFPFAGAKAIPYGQLVRRKEELNPAVDMVVVCKIGTRSVYAIRSLREAGYSGRMYNLKDGTNAWARDVDKSLTQY
jgi:adenylyltransferase/sulfurtransferase